ncbi:MAG: hypothetical protein MZV49_20440 [Rhodopseudomonas palustris]|nr:hypothetical protein [Rhodopseudomonas palustris]
MAAAIFDDPSKVTFVALVGQGSLHGTADRARSTCLSRNTDLDACRAIPIAELSISPASPTMTVSRLHGEEVAARSTPALDLERQLKSACRTGTTTEHARCRLSSRANNHEVRGSDRVRHRSTRSLKAYRSPAAATRSRSDVSQLYALRLKLGDAGRSCRAAGS